MPTILFTLSTRGASYGKTTIKKNYIFKDCGFHDRALFYDEQADKFADVKRVSGWS